MTMIRDGGPLRRISEWWGAHQQQIRQGQRARWWRRALRENAVLWDQRDGQKDDPLPGSHLPPWAVDLLTAPSGGRSPSASTLQHGGLIHVWRKHRQPFEMIASNAQEFIDTLQWAQDHDQGPFWDAFPLRGTAQEAPVLLWADNVAAEHQASLFSTPIDWFGPSPHKNRMDAHTRTQHGVSEQQLPAVVHQQWRDGALQVLDNTADSNTPMQVMALALDDWPVVVVRWNPIALAVMTRRWDRVHAWSQQGPLAARDAHHLLTVMGRTPPPDQPEDVAGWERWVLTDLTQAPNPSVARARSRL